MKKEEPEDRVLALGPVRPGAVTPGLRVSPDGKARTVGITPIKDGQPIMGEVGVADGRGGWKVVCATSSGPAQVASEDYRDGWERTFGGKPRTVGEA